MTPHSRLTASTVALAAALALGACSQAKETVEPIRAVRTLTVSLSTAGGSHEFAAEVRARTESRLGFRVPGKMTQRLAEVGQHVSQGQALAQLDATDLRLGMDAAQAAVQSAQASFELASAEFQRFRGLREQGFISAAELERRETTLRAAQAQLQQARAQAGAQGNQTAYATLVAGAAGVVTAVEAEVGAVLGAGTPVFRVAHDGPRDVVFAVPEDGAAAMRALMGKPGAVKVRPWGEPGLLPTTVREVAAAADPVTRTFLVKADLGAAKLQLGQTLTAVIELPRLSGVTKLPLSAVLQQQGQSSVWLLDRTSMTVKLQPIVVAGADGNSVVVASGLSPGQTVVTAGVHVLNPGQKVSLYESSGPPPAVLPTMASTPKPGQGPTAAASR